MPNVLSRYVDPSPAAIQLVSPQESIELRALIKQLSPSHTSSAGADNVVALAMPGRGRDAGGMSGGERAGSGRKKTKLGLTRKEKKLAKEAAAAAAAAGIARITEDELCAHLVKKGKRRSNLGVGSSQSLPVQMRTALGVAGAPIVDSRTSERVAAAEAASMKESAAKTVAAAEASKCGPLDTFFKPLPAAAQLAAAQPMPA